MERRTVTVAAAAVLVSAALGGCSGPGGRAPAPVPSAVASSPRASPSAPSPAGPPEVVAIRWTTTRFPDQARLEWSLPPGTDTVDSFRIRYLVNGRERIAQTEYFFLVLTGLRSGDEVRAFVLARGPTKNSGEVESATWRQP